jgi:cytoskeleton protein RodZ
LAPADIYEHMTKVTRLTLEEGGSLERRRLHLREISEEADAPLETVGQDIRTARQRKGEDLSTVSRALKIRKDHLEALEEGNIHALPGRPYAIGFLRSYAEYLGLDPAQCVERFKAEIAGRDDSDTATPQLAVEEERSLPHGSLIFLVLLVIAVVYGGYYLSVSANRMLAEPVAPVPDRLATEAGIPANDQPKPAPKQSTQAQPAAAPTAAPSDGSSDDQSAVAPSSDNTVAAVSPAQMPGENTDTSSGSAQMAALPPGRTYGAHNDNARVELRVYKPTRILVEGADNTVYINRTLKPGDVYRAPNQVGLTLTTPDGGAIEIILDGSSMGFAGKRGETSEGLSLDPQSIVDRRGGARSG